MNLSDLDFDPRPDASQRVAAKRRTRPVQTDKPIVWRQYATPVGVVGCLLAAAILFTRLPSVPPMRPSATSAPALFSAPSRTPVLPTVTKEPTERPSATQEPSQEATAAAVEATPEPATAEPPIPTDVPTAWPTPRVATPTLIPSISPIMALIKQRLDSIATPTQGALVLTPGGCVLCHTH